MTVYAVILMVYSIMAGTFSIFVIAARVDHSFKLNDLYSPIQIYKNTEFNIIGVSFFAVLCHILAPLPAPAFWLYKVCTIGRKN